MNKKDIEYLKHAKLLVVGSGISGSVVAERIASDCGKQVAVIDRRDHAGGNCYSYIDPATGIECHEYGTHIFHTSDKEIAAYLKKFCTLNRYRHRVFSSYRGNMFELPVNLATINRFYKERFTPVQAKRFLKTEAAKEGSKKPGNFEEKALMTMGRPLYEAFIKGYTKKQWGTDPKKLPAGIIERLPLRYTGKTGYFDDRHQGLPLCGYGGLFNKLLKNKNIRLMLKTDYFSVKRFLPPGCLVIFTGPIDLFYGYKHGRLGWRSLRFDKLRLPTGDHQHTAVVNYPDEDIKFTRIHEFRHLHPERHYTKSRTVISKEYPVPAGRNSDPYYPIGSPADIAILKKYQQESQKDPGVFFLGRLGRYKYLDMDDAIKEALQFYRKVLKKKCLNLP
jgi:UDP-galactopyranose mutase